MTAARGLTGPLSEVPTLFCKDRSVLAKTTVAEASQELVIQALVPFRTHESPSARAVVEAAPASLPFPAPKTDSESVPPPRTLLPTQQGTQPHPSAGDYHQAPKGPGLGPERRRQGPASSQGSKSKARHAAVGQLPVWPDPRGRCPSPCSCGDPVLPGRSQAARATDPSQQRPQIPPPPWASPALSESVTLILR